MVGLATLVCVAPLLSEAADSSDILGLDPWLTLSGNFDAGYRETQFFETDHNAAVGQWDTRLELWVPPQGKLSFGPYLRFAGIASSHDPAWENGLLAAPGGGFQVYPFSLPAFTNADSIIGKIFGPVRLFGEYNRLDYWGTVNQWRPDHQIRAGMEYWRELHVNDTANWWWGELWTGAFWQSANEFDQHYDTLIFANALRAGARIPNQGWLSAFTPYLAVESSLTRNDQYYWENKLVVGGGLRFAPDQKKLPDRLKWLNRFVVYAEYVHDVAYYHASPPSSIPDYDVRAGISASIGKWYYADHGDK